MKKVLFLPVSVGLAHIGRSIEVARELKKRNIEVFFGAGSDGPKILKQENLPFAKIPEFPREIYDRKIKHNNWSIYSIGLINKFVKSEIELVESFKPDLIVSDIRLTAKITSFVTGIPLVSITNVDATKYYDYSKIKLPYKTYLGRFLPPVILNFLGTPSGQELLRRLGPGIIWTVFLKELFKFNLVLARYGKKPLLTPYDLTKGDLTLLADIPQFRPVKKLSKNVKLVGPIFWNGRARIPSWANKITKKKIIYVTASGTGDKELFIKILGFLKGEPYIVIATCGNTLSLKEVDINFPNLFLADYLPGAWIMEKAELIIFPGGNATAYQALYFGVPQIGTPLHLDHEDNMNQLVRLGTAIMLDPRKDFNRERLLTAIEKILHEEKFKKNALKLKDEMKKYDGPKQAAEEIVKFLKVRS